MSLCAPRCTLSGSIEHYFPQRLPLCHRLETQAGRAQNTLQSVSMPPIDIKLSSSTTPASPSVSRPEEFGSAVFGIQKVTVSYNNTPAIADVSFSVRSGEVTALIGPSGCGKSTLLRSFNRMNDLIGGASVKGLIEYHGVDLYDKKVDPVEVRRRIGMVFQKPNPFPKSIYENVAFGPQLNKRRGNYDDVVERALTRAALWDEVKDKLKQSAFALSGGQQQRLCIARCLATNPDVILMDEPCSALDPIATARIEDLMAELKSEVTIVIVTHNMQQAARISDMTAFITTDVTDDGSRVGRLVEFDSTGTIFTNPSDARTEGYVTGRFG